MTRISDSADDPWRLGRGEIEAILSARCGDPFKVLGLHETPAGFVIRTFVPGAETVHARTPEGREIAALESPHSDGFFEGLIHGATARFPYVLHARNAGGSWDYHDPYAFGPLLGPLDDYLLVEGAHQKLYQRLGAHVVKHEGVDGTHFAVWAPNARRVSVVGDFNDWDGRRGQMRKRVDSGVWEIFLPGVDAGPRYKFEIVAANGALTPLKADPFGRAGELRPATASIVVADAPFPWTDEAFLADRARKNPRRAPLSIYEVHLPSWARSESGQFLSYDDLAAELIPYVADLGFTHIELLPVNEHPLDASWGYQPIGLFAPTARHGPPDGFKRLIDAAHQAGLGVILDWVPAHFPTDTHGLAMFDGGPLFEHSDPRRGFHPDWNTAIYDFGRREVANFLICNALYWLDCFHIDGLRVDAVASMLYLDYSRKSGEWAPNPDGSNDNRDAVAFLKRFNETVHDLFPGVVTLAEESTSWSGVSRPTSQGGLGFDFKWNMGWMNDTLRYMSLDPIFRQHHHGELTFSLLYAFHENFVLPLSHDEVVHGKRSLLEKMPGDDWQQFANLRLLFGYMFAHPGKKLNFMGSELGQRGEFWEASAVDWSLEKSPWHLGVQRLMADLNRLHRTERALYEVDFEWSGFEWINANDAASSVLTFMRRAKNLDDFVVVVCNFTPVAREEYRVGVPRPGFYREILNTDSEYYAGTNLGNAGGVQAEPIPWNDRPYSIKVRLPGLAAVYFKS